MGSSHSSEAKAKEPAANAIVAPDDDPYDPRKPEYIIPASTKDVMTENSRMRLRQIRRLEFALSTRERRRDAKARTSEGGVLRHYRHYLHELHPGERSKTSILAARDVPMPVKAAPSQLGASPPTSSAPAAAIFIAPPATASATACTSATAAPNASSPAVEARASAVPTASSPAVVVNHLH
mmetsp:Transcript_25767/g.60833  ORF Transcript_25767/g.60833 Transcript_25767/m.60833 type:complete len:181 (-) Transcript_25767:89-631(-)